MGLVKIYLCTKFEVSSFTRSKFRCPMQMLEIWHLKPHHVPFGVIFVIREMELAKVYHSTCVPNLKFL